ncbi:MAG: hypothetical protein HY900_16645 [Deltaproteobacteria bacterium]|nr:hypothetical protein [Deltaproteobacteria bacterium]
MGERVKETAGEYSHELREFGGKAWEATRRAVFAAGTRTAQYGRRVQQRLDLAAADRRIDAHYRDLGRRVFDALREGDGELLLHQEIQDVVRTLTKLHEERVSLVRGAESAAEVDEGQPREDMPTPETELRAEEEQRHQ